MIKIIGQLLIWAALLLGIAAVGVALKLYWHKLRVALGFRGKDKPENEFN